MDYESLTLSGFDVLTQSQLGRLEAYTTAYWLCTSVANQDWTSANTTLAILLFFPSF